MEPSPKAAAEEEDEDGGGGVDESEALLGNNKKKGEKTPAIVPSKGKENANAAVRVAPSSRDAVKVSAVAAGEPAKPKVKKPYLNTDV